MPTKIGQISEMELKQVPLPTGFSKQYVTVSHGYIIDTVKDLLDQNNYEIKETIYRCTNGGEVVQAVYHINHGDDPELGLMFAWSNSYDRSQRFKCAVGAHVFICGNGMLIGDMANYGKVHKGDKKQVLQNVTDHITLQLKSASNFYDMIKKDKEAMKNICLTEKEIAELMGVLYFQEDLLTSGQLITSKKQFEEPSYDYNAPLNSLWSLYNHVTYSFKTSHPKKWMDTQANFHQFIAKTYIPKPVIDPNQMNITDVIEVPDNQLITSEVTPNPLGEDDMNSCPEKQEEWDQQTRIEEGLDHKGEFPEHDPVSLRVRDGEIEQFDDETGEVIKNEALDNVADEKVNELEMFVLQFYNEETEELEDNKCKLIPVDEYDEYDPEYKDWRYEGTGMIFNKETVVLINKTTIMNDLLKPDDNVLIDSSGNLADEEADMIEKEEIIAEREEEDVLTEAEVTEKPSDEISFDNYPGLKVDEDINLSELNDIESELKKDSQEDHDEKEDNVTEDVVEESNDDKLELPEFEF